MKDIFDLLKQLFSEFVKLLTEQFPIWWQFINSPISVISKIDTGSKDSFRPALKLALFAYLVSASLSIPEYIIYYRLKFFELETFVTDLFIFVLTFLATLFCFQISVKIFKGRGGLYQTLLALLYLTSFLPFITIVDYFILPTSKSILCPSSEGLEFPITHIVLFFFGFVLGIWLFRKMVSVIKYIYSVSTLRAGAISILGVGLVVIIVSVVIYPIHLRFTGYCESP